MICADNTNTFQASYIPAAFVISGDRQKWPSVAQVQVHSNQSVLVFRPEDFVWLELSIVNEVERVFVERRGDSFQVTTIVNDRSPELRRHIFAREKAIIDALPQYEFDFDILTRMNHDLNDLVGTIDKPSYARV